MRKVSTLRGEKVRARDGRTDLDNPDSEMATAHKLDPDNEPAKRHRHNHQ